jgi:hypothetical protein
MKARLLREIGCVGRFAGLGIPASQEQSTQLEETLLCANQLMRLFAVGLETTVASERVIEWL